MESLIAASRETDYPAEIALVLSNNPEAAGLASAKAQHIATNAIDHRQFGKDRPAFEAALQAELEKYSIEFICLAGFMRILTRWFVERWYGRMINIHPSILPSYKGLHTHARALADGVKLHGCTVHFVVPEMDAGPIILQAAVHVMEDDTADTLAARALAQEHRIYPQALALTASGAIHIEGQRVVSTYLSVT